MTWNCKQGFHKKIEHIAALAPDIAVIPECGNMATTHPTILPTSYHWVGRNQHKGLAIYSFTNLKLVVGEEYDESIEWVVPIRATGQKQFNLLAIWAMNGPDRKNSYVGRVHRALDHYSDFITERETIVIGDFNSSAVWDRQYRQENHSQAVQRLAEYGLISTYHAFYNEQQGQEISPTFYLYHHQHRHYHIDYCFVPQAWLTRISRVEVGRYEDWCQYSDHCPLIVDIC